MLKVHIIPPPANQLAWHLFHALISSSGGSVQFNLGCGEKIRSTQTLNNCAKNQQQANNQRTSNSAASSGQTCLLWDTRWNQVATFCDITYWFVKSCKRCLNLLFLEQKWPSLCKTALKDWMNISWLNGWKWIGAKAFGACPQWILMVLQVKSLPRGFMFQASICVMPFGRRCSKADDMKWFKTWSNHPSNICNGAQSSWYRWVLNASFQLRPKAIQD